LKSFVLLICATLLLSPHIGRAQQVYNGDSPAWLAAVGKLTVPGQTWDGQDWHHSREHCSATLLRQTSAAPAQYLLSAWHCVEHYRDLSHDIAFELPGSDRVRQARLVASGGSMKADWALLKLLSPIPASAAISLPLPFSAGSGENLVMAGYSSGPLGKLGSAPLSYDNDCQVLDQDQWLVSTNCQASKGASGGPVVSEIEGEVQILGIVSSGDGVSRSLYVPVTVFARALRQYL
jgi:hypothetical protein